MRISPDSHRRWVRSKSDLRQAAKKDRRFCASVFGDLAASPASAPMASSASAAAETKYKGRSQPGMGQDRVQIRFYASDTPVSPRTQAIDAIIAKGWTEEEYREAGISLGCIGVGT